MKFSLLLLYLSCLPMSFVKPRPSKKVGVRLSTDERNMRLLSSQLSKLKGVKNCIFHIDGKARVKLIETLQSKLAKAMPTMNLKDIKSRLQKYKRRDFGKRLPKSREQRGLLNYASQSSLLIFVFFNYPNCAGNIAKIQQTYHTLALPQSVPKVLVVLTTKSKRSNYREIFKILSRMKIFAVEVLVIRPKVLSKHLLKVSRKRLSRMGLKNRGHSFEVHQFNHFTKTYKKQKLTRKVKWFSEQMYQNLHGHRLTSRFVHTNSTYLQIENGKEMHFKSALWGENSELANHIRKSMNTSFKNTGDWWSDVTIYPVFVTWTYKDIGYLKPIEFTRHQFYTPVIYDTHTESNTLEFYTFLAVVFVVVITVRVCRIIASLSSLSVFKLLLGLDDPYYCGTVVESCVFMFLSVMGLFFSNQFSEAATGILVPVKLERTFHTFQDLKDSNFTLYLAYDPIAVHSEATRLTGRIKHPILSLQLDYEVQDKFFEREVVMMSNISHNNQSRHKAISVGSGMTFFDIHGSTIVHDQKPLARRTDLTENSWVMAYITEAFNPYIERLSDLYWRYLESGFSNFGVRTKQKCLSHCRTYFTRLMDSYSQEDSEELDDVSIVPVLLIVLLSGLSGALLLLLAEILHHAFYKYIKVY